MMLYLNRAIPYTAGSTSCLLGELLYTGVNEQVLYVVSNVIGIELVLCKRGIVICK
jgi:hypothetical protein